MKILRRIMLKGFKSIRELDLELRPTNVLIGANGAGKSNLISFFNMLREMMDGRLQQYLATNGHAHSLLYYGPRLTSQIQARLEFEENQFLDAYDFTLAQAAGDTLFFASETLLSTRTGSARDAAGTPLGK